MPAEPKLTSVPQELVNTKGVEDNMKANTAVTACESESFNEVAEPKKAPAVKKSTPKVSEKEEEIEAEIVASVDFSEEDDALAAEAPEFDLGEEDDAEEPGRHVLESASYAGKTEAELVSAFERLVSEKPVQTLRKDAEAIKVAFYKSRRINIEAQRAAFIEAGGNVEEFTPATDENENRLKELFADYRTKRNDFMSKIDEEREKNHKVKLQIIEELKDLINSNETMHQTFNSFRELQQRWKDAGAIPQTAVKDLWETYNHHVENFYNFIKINNELRDLDLKKNYEVKLHLCEEAEELVLDVSIINSFHKLQKLHDSWRETGPVANEYKDQLWERFKEASSKINKRHQEHFEGIKDEQKSNLDLKTGLCEKVEDLSSGILSTRKEWNKASDQLIEVQKVWKTIGFAPKKDNAKIYERFRNACDKFFENKRNYYLSLKGEMDNNLLLKQEICEQAESLKDSDDWKKTSDELISLQKRWKDMGPVPRRHSDAIWKRFRTACDAFFERKSKHFSKQDNEYEQNLQQKRALIEELKALNSAEAKINFEDIKTLQRRWTEVGFVPFKFKNSLQAEYREILDSIFTKLRGSEKERNIERFKGKLSNMGDGADRKVRNERERLFNSMKQMETDIALLENNIGFFSKSKNAEQMIRDVNDKISRLKSEMETIIAKIDLIDGKDK